MKATVTSIVALCVALMPMCAHGYRPPPTKILLPFSEARETVQLQSLRTKSEWSRWWADNRKRWRYTKFFMPEDPQVAYSEKWVDWDDWLGVPLPFEEAQRVASTLGVVSQEMWWAVTREQASLLLRLRLPSRPHIYYRDEWQGYDKWLGKADVPFALPRLANTQEAWGLCEGEGCSVIFDDELIDTADDAGDDSN